MNKEYRQTVNVRVAFSSAAKNAFLMPGAAIPRRSRGLPIGRRAMLSHRLERYCARYIHFQLPRIVCRWLVKRLYRTLRPLIMPVAFRIRRYLMSGLNSQSQLDHAAAIESLQHICQNLIGETAHIRAALDQIRPINSAVSPLLELQQQLQRFTQSQQSEWQRLSETFKGCVERYADLVTSKMQHSHQESVWDSSLLEDKLNEVQDNLQRQTLNFQDQAANWSSRFDRIESYSLASARRVAIQCEPGEVMVRTQVGYVMCPTNDPAVLACLIDAGELEPGTRQLIERLLQPGDTFVDVGANLGLHTIGAGRALQGRGRIIAFEPYEPTWRLLQKSVWINGFVDICQIHRAAVSNRTGQQSFFLGATSGHHSLYKVQGHHPLLPAPVEVALVKLDDVVQENQVTLIKIDVEGAEIDVIQGAEKLLRDHPNVGLIVEFGLSHLQHTGYCSAQWLNVFDELGFMRRKIDPQTGTLSEISLPALEATATTNLFFARASSPLWARAEGLS